MLTHKPMAAKLWYSLLGWEEDSGVVPRCVKLLFSLQRCALSLTKPTQPYALEETTVALEAGTVGQTAEAVPSVHSCSELLLSLQHRASSWESPAYIYSIFSWRAQHSTEKPKDLTLIPPAGTPRAPTQNQEAQVGGSTQLNCLNCPPHSLGVSPAEWKYNSICIILDYYTNNNPVLHKWNYICGAASGLHLHME